MIYLIIFALLLVAELVYFRIADRFNIIDRPNERSSHSSIVLRGGGVIFSLAMVAWAVMVIVQGDWQLVLSYLPFLAGLMMVAECFKSNTYINRSMLSETLGEELSDRQIRFLITKMEKAGFIERKGGGKYVQYSQTADFPKFN